ncbi:phage tail tape measure protein [Alcaligenes phenolicus]|uniref:phage tail tape measure protein n=1 Tax=Alcaligenes phenolicus TaxID=232846 RepID=UPI000E975521|nr:phage tail tape measure protein [Alcaligenes phenolicus]HBJ69993.1 phage tail tape measure protein [Alcaligenes faecalis]
MSSRSLGTLTYDLIAKIGGFVAGMTEAERVADRKTREMERKSKARAKAMSDAWSKASKLVTAGIAGITVGSTLLKIINETKQAEDEQAQLATVLRSTANSAGYTKTQLNEMADAMSALSVVSSGEINQAQTTLLAFTGIVGDEFPRALQSAIDMAQRTGMSVVSAAETVGRALDVPSKGLTALSRQGFRFTEEQKKLAEKLEAAGKTAEAQGIILQALEESYGGAAKAARDTFGGALSALQNQINSLLTGSDGSLDEAKKAVNDLTDSLGGEDARKAFDAVIGWVVDLTAALAEMVVQFGLGLKNSDGFFDAMVRYGLADPFKSSAEHLSRVRKEIDAIESAGSNPLKGILDGGNLFTLGPGKVSLIGGDSGRQEALRKLRQEEDYYAAMVEREQAKRERELFRGLLGVQETGAPVQELAPIPVRPNGGGTKPKKTGSTVDEGQRFIQQMRERIALIGLETEQEKLLAKAVIGTIKFKSEGDKAEAVRLAGQYDSAKAAYEQKKAVEELTVSYGRLLDEQERNYQAQLNSMGLGEKNRQYLAEQIQIQDEFRKRQENLDDALRRGDVSRERYETELRMLDEAQGRSLALLDRYNSEKQKKERDWLLGAQEALINYGDEAANIYASVADAVAGAFKGMEDALVQFVKTGKLDFKSLADSIISDLARIAVRQGITGPLSGMLGGLLTNTLSGLAMGLGGGVNIGSGFNLGASLGGGSGATFGPMMRLSSGGYTGDGGKYELAGLVHKGEGVLNQDEINALGGEQGFNRLRQALKGPGHSSGGMAGRPALPPAVQGGGQWRPGVVINNNVSGIEFEEGMSNGQLMLEVDRRIDRRLPKAMAREQANPNSRLSRQQAASLAVSRKR